MDRHRTEAERRAAEYGIDLSLIDLALTRTPFERVLAHERALELAEELPRAGEAEREQFVGAGARTGPNRVTAIVR